MKPAESVELIVFVESLRRLARHLNGRFRRRPLRGQADCARRSALGRRSHRWWLSRTRTNSLTGPRSAARVRSDRSNDLASPGSRPIRRRVALADSGERRVPTTGDLQIERRRGVNRIRTGQFVQGYPRLRTRTGNGRLSSAGEYLTSGFRGAIRGMPIGTLAARLSDKRSVRSAVR